MNIHFEVAERQANGQVMTQYNPASGIAEIIYWNVSPEHVPSFVPGTSHVIIRAVDTTVIPSIWKGFMGAASNGLNTLTNKLNSMFNQQQQPVQPGFEQPTNAPKAPFRPTEVHTGVKVIMPRDKVLKLVGAPECYRNGLIIAGGDIVEYSTVSKELTVDLYNMLQVDVTLQKGDIIAYGYFFTVESTIVPSSFSSTPLAAEQTVPTPSPFMSAPKGAPIPGTIRQPGVGTGVGTEINFMKQ